ncbi:MAG TPA: cyclic nucleotide-binding domain-containing protein [Solirubrobacteraceae bacterium]
MKRLDELIAAATVFEGLRPAQLELIAGCGGNEHVREGTFLFKEGERADRFYLIRHGAIALEVHAPGAGSHVVETLGEGEVVGWSWLFKPYRWQFDARAIEPTRMVAFDGACLRGKCDADHELGYQLMQRFAGAMLERLQATRLQLLDIYGNVGDRV